MDTIKDSKFTSPKRKRFPPAFSTIPPPPPPSSRPSETRPSSKVPQTAVINDEETPGSPRTKIAYSFSRLQLEEHAEVAHFKLDMPPPNLPIFRELMQDENSWDEEEIARKRHKLLKKRKAERLEIPETPDPRRKKSPWEKFSVAAGPSMSNVNHIIAAKPEGEALRNLKGSPESNADHTMAAKPEGEDLRNLVDPVIFRESQITKVKGAGDLQMAYPNINRLSDSKSRPKKRSGTPPLGSLVAALGEDAEKAKIIDPERAALTWHDDEITGHNPSDPEDDGEGINGIGFRPTNAEAYARSQKRRQQMAEYKNREAKEARRNRIEKRRNNDREMGSKEAETSRRVRFMETSAVHTTPSWTVLSRAQDDRGLVG